MVNVREKWESAGKINTLYISECSAKVMREGVDKASVQQYIGMFQKNIAKVLKVGRTVKQGECQE